MLTRACEQLATWRTALGEGADFFVAFNVSAAPLSSPGFIDALAEVLERTGVPASMVHLELTESLLVDSDAGSPRWPACVSSACAWQSTTSA